jgi:hypothetical protein
MLIAIGPLQGGGPDRPGVDRSRFSSPVSRSMPSRTILPPNDLRSPVAVIALVIILLSPSPRPGGRDHVEGARSGIHRGFTAVSFAGSGARRSVPHE